MRWQIVLAMILSLHMGLAQAVMAGAPVDMPRTHEAASDIVAEKPCHLAIAADDPAPAGDDSAPAEQEPEKTGCCSAGQCHCSAASGLPIGLSPLRLPRLLTPAVFLAHAGPSLASAPDLRPPIR
jgi:hypothetical protein